MITAEQARLLLGAINKREAQQAKKRAEDANVLQLAHALQLARVQNKRMTPALVTDMLIKAFEAGSSTLVVGIPIEALRHDQLPLTIDSKLQAQALEDEFTSLGATVIVKGYGARTSLLVTNLSGVIEKLKAGGSGW